MDEDRRRWDARYADAGEAAPRPPDALTAGGLVDVVPTSGRALDVAAGLGPVTLWAAQRGLDVIALDVSGEAIDRLTAAAVAAGSGERVDARRVDLDGGPPDGLGEFDLVVCQRFRDPDVIAALPDLVAPRGTLVVTVLSEVGADSPGPFHAPAGELDRLLPGGPPWDVAWRNESDGESSVVLRRVTEASS